MVKYMISSCLQFSSDYSLGCQNIKTNKVYQQKYITDSIISPLSLQIDLFLFDNIYSTTIT